MWFYILFYYFFNLFIFHFVILCLFFLIQRNFFNLTLQLFSENSNCHIFNFQELFLVLLFFLFLLNFFFLIAYSSCSMNALSSAISLWSWSTFYLNAFFYSVLWNNTNWLQTLSKEKSLELDWSGVLDSWIYQWRLPNCSNFGSFPWLIGFLYKRTF